MCEYLFVIDEEASESAARGAIGEYDGVVGRAGPLEEQRAREARLELGAGGERDGGPAGGERAQLLERVHDAHVRQVERVVRGQLCEQLLGAPLEQRARELEHLLRHVREQRESHVLELLLARPALLEEKRELQHSARRIGRNQHVSFSSKSL